MFVLIIHGKENKMWPLFSLPLIFCMHRVTTLHTQSSFHKLVMGPSLAYLSISRSPSSPLPHPPSPVWRAKKRSTPNCVRHYHSLLHCSPNLGTWIAEFSNFFSWKVESSNFGDGISMSQKNLQHYFTNYKDLKVWLVYHLWIS